MRVTKIWENVNNFPKILFLAIFAEGLQYYMSNALTSEFWQYYTYVQEIEGKIHILGSIHIMPYMHNFDIVFIVKMVNMLL